MNRFFLFLLTIFAVLVSACGPVVRMEKSSLARVTDPQISDADLNTLVSGNNTFALDLYQSLRTKEGNLVLSPYSVSTAFAMTYAGARGDTASQIASALHFDLADDQLHGAFNALDLALAKHASSKVPKDRDPIQLNIVNTIWAQEDFSFQSPFLETLGRDYDAGMYLVDFVNQPDAARKKINGSVSRETKDKIKDLIPAGALNNETRLVLVNAVYFKADWLEAFDVTRDAPFHLLDGSQISVPTMQLAQIYMRYAEGEHWLAVELPYAGETFAMVIIAPKAGSFAEFEANMDYQSISTIISSLKTTGMDLFAPKFEFDNDFRLADQLKSLGISDAFSPGRADFSGMTGKRDLYLSETFHKTYVFVDEEGTRAAAATGQDFGLISSSMPDPIPVHIDRPFIFIIHDVKSGQFLFIGRVLDPTQ